MDALIGAAIEGFSLVFSWPNLLYPIVGTLLAMVFAFLPGIGGITLMALAIPFTFSWGQHEIVLLFGALMGGATFMGSVTAVLFNVPGTAPNAATMLDGHPMAKRGEAETAISCAASASALGSSFGILVLIVLLPLIRPLILAFGPLEFLLLTVWGLTTVAMVGGGSRLKGMAAAGIGLLLAFVGLDPRTAEPRFTFGMDYLVDGLKIVPVLLGLFALAEIIHLAVSGRVSVSGLLLNRELTGSVKKGLLAPFRYGGLFLRCSAIGTLVGMIPGIGGTVAGFIAYGHAVQTSRGNRRFGKGDLRGVMAPEAANDAKDAGSLVPALAFGIPGSEATVLLLMAFSLHGIVPGRELLAQDLSLVFALIWTLFFSNWMTSLLGLSVAGRLARLTTLRTELLVPVVFALVAIAAVVFRGSLTDLAVTVVFGIVGYSMKIFGWSRITLMIALVLGSLFEANLHLTLQLHNLGRLDLFDRPIGAILCLLILLTSVLPVILARHSARSRGTS